ncbi:hypothetical protein PTSG_11565 [Salpingoeca rosetta]|uniref:Dynein regulatory complex protein 12 n=1 Tax=Salpingoeca rosetta (strain ATCC 50818 / BSB-021) TaxID=946362 RepID=F2TVX3_SALR5|nr:uncharacterized protein PTSG_11565 [Salpingoeca rosetta]EGD72219.1 hypothetical protein PTSG_11565 [Salpingoeca rosetta]|eukprot:XP_004998790.1 hypothetical protein PTSG_11565 [Salpingoeca rosetta]
MPPKKKKGTKKKKKTGKADKNALTEEDATKRAQLEADMLRTSLAEVRDEARRTTQKVHSLTDNLTERQGALDLQTQTTQDITSDLTRQYKLMQSQLMARIMDLQEHTRVLQDQLEVTQRALAETKEQADKSIREKNDMIAQLTQRIQSMESAYEGVLNHHT